MISVPRLAKSIENLLILQLFAAARASLKLIRVALLTERSPFACETGRISTDRFEATRATKMLRVPAHAEHPKHLEKTDPTPDENKTAKYSEGGTSRSSKRE